jgi:histidinol phosphatase-like PHP family hydrolase
MLPQDLHIHTIFSTGDSAVVPQQTPQLIAALNHARIRGISDHIEYLYGSLFQEYSRIITELGFRLGAEIVNVDDVDYAMELPLEYRVFHCYDNNRCYKAAQRMVDSGIPLIIAHPMALDTNLGRVPPECHVEINNRYIWRNDWKSYFTPWVKRFNFVYSSDAHQPNWLNQNVARYVGEQLGIIETLLFEEKAKISAA